MLVFLWVMLIAYVINIIRSFAVMSLGEREITATIKPSDQKVNIALSTVMLLWVVFLLLS